ncbi:MAG: ABC transporter permease [Puniceicoccales bacterium]|jgi:ABC-type transport system involved in multi-copper enzyme maturation permease subunit|nr:ABC transporter permease [Puniceicoccales bacterium]
MDRFFAVLSYEWRRVSRAPGFLAVGGIFLLLSTLVFWSVFPSYGAGPRSVRPAVLWLERSWPMVLVLIPALTADTIAGERSAGTFEGLFRDGAAAVEIVLGKFCTLYIYSLFLWSFALILQPLALRAASLSLPFPLATGSEFLKIFRTIALGSAFYLSCGLFLSTIARSSTAAGAATFALLTIFLFGPRIVSKLLSADRWPILWDLLARLAIGPAGRPESVCGGAIAGLVGTATATALVLSAIFLRRR